MSLADLIAGPHGDLADLHRLLGGGMPAQGVHEAQLRLKARWQNPALLRGDLARRRAEGYRSVLAMGQATLFEALGRRTEEALPQVLPIAPNLQGFMREAVEYGMVGAGLRRAWRVGPVALTGLGLRGVGRLGALARREFPAMLRSFIELELADFKRYQPPAIFLQAAIADLAIAMHNPRIIEAFIESAGQLGAAPGLMTHNFPGAIAALKSWGLEVSAIITPWHPAEQRLRPNAEAWHNAARGAGLPLWADRRLASFAPSAEERGAMARHGIVGALRDDLAVWCAS